MSIRIPSLNARQLTALLKRAGFEIAYQDSSHLYFHHPKTVLTTCVPVHSGDVKRNLVRKILLKDCGLSIQEVQKLL